MALRVKPHIERELPLWQGMNNECKICCNSAVLFRNDMWDQEWMCIIDLCVLLLHDADFSPVSYPCRVMHCLELSIQLPLSMARKY